MDHCIMTSVKEMQTLSLRIQTKTEDERDCDQRLNSKTQVLKSNACPSKEQRQQYFQRDHCSLTLTGWDCSSKHLCSSVFESSPAVDKRTFRVPLKSDFVQPPITLENSSVTSERSVFWTSSHSDESTEKWCITWGHVLFPQLSALCTPPVGLPLYGH